MTRRINPRSFVALRNATLVAAMAACSGMPTAPTGVVGGLPTNSGGATPGSGAMPSASIVDVVVQDFIFSTSTVTVKAGTTVRWTNRGPSAHTVTSDAGGWGSGTLGAPMNSGGSSMGGPMSGGMDGGMMGGMDGMGGMSYMGTMGGGMNGSTMGGSFTYTFTQPGTYRYHCTIHPPAAYPGFTGAVVVTP